MDRRPPETLSKNQSAADTYRWYWKNHERAKALKRAAMRRHRAKDPQRHRDIAQRYRDRQRARLLAMYGTACVICGFSDRRALTLDHVQRNGKQERTAHGERGVYIKAIATYRPDLYRTLCMNCQFITRSEPA